MTEEEIQTFLEDDKHCPFSIDDVSNEDLLNESGKMRLMLEVTKDLKSKGQNSSNAHSLAIDPRGSSSLDWMYEVSSGSIMYPFVSRPSNTDILNIAENLGHDSTYIAVT